MANTQTFSIKLTANGKEVKALQEELIKLANKYEEDLKGINEQLKERDKLTKEEIKALERQSNSLASKIKGLNTAVEENITNLRTVNDVMKNLAGSSSGELGKALRGLGSDFKRVSDQTLKSGETMEQKLTEIKEKMMEVRHEMTKRDGIDALKRAQTSLQELANTPLDKLKMGLNSIEKKLATMSNAERQAAVGLTLMQGRAQHKAQIALTELGSAGFSSDIQKMNEEQLRAEQQRLRSLYGATSGAKGFEIISQEALSRIHEVNDALAELRKNVDAIELSKVDFDNLNTTSLEKLEAMLKQIEKDEKALTASDKTASEQMARNKRKVQEAILRVRNNTIDLANAQKVAGERGKHSVQDMQRAYDTLKQHLTTLSTSQTDEIRKTQQQMKYLKADIDSVTGAVNKQQSAWGSLGTTLKNLVAYAGVFAGFNRLKSLLGEVYTKNMELSDQLANIRKVSGLTMQDINQLSANLAKIDTRSSIQQLNELAYAGAKLGFGNYGTEGLESFVKSAVKVQNALSEDMGEESMTALSKLVEVMGLIPKMGVERAMDSAGSAIFKLASTSTATGTNIIEFTKRLMGLANVSHVTTSELLALGSASDSMGMLAEVSSTAFTKMFTSIQSNYAGIEKAVGLAEGTLKSLLDQGRTMDALVEVFDKMHGMSMEEMKARGIFKELGSEGSRMNNVMTTMANKIDMLREHLLTSNEAFEEANAVAKEYEIQMDTAQAYAERAANIWEKAFVNPEGVDVVKEFSKAWYEVSKSLTTNEKFMFSIQLSLKGILLLLKGIMAILPELFAMLLSGGVWSFVTWLKTSKGLVASLTSWFVKLTAAQKAFFKAAGWVGIALTIFEVGKAIVDMSTKVKKANEYMKDFNATLSDVNKEQYTAVRRLDGYVKAINEATAGTNQRKAAINNFNKVYKPYLSSMLTEKSTALDVAKAYQEVVKQMKAKIALQAKEKDIEKFINPRLQWEADKLEAYDKSVSGTGNQQYNGAWLKGFVDDARAAGKSIYDLAIELNDKVFHLNGETFANVYSQKGKENVSRVGKKTRYSSAGLPYNLEILGEQTAEAQLQKAIQYALQSYSTSNAMYRINKKYKPWENEIDNLVATEEAVEPYTPIGGAGTDTVKVPEWMVEEKKEAEKSTKAVIGSIEEFYRLQEAAANELAANGSLNGADFEMLVKHIQDRKDKMLLEARRAIAGDPNEFEKERKLLQSDIVKRDDKVSQSAMQRIQQADPAKQGSVLRKYDGSDAVYGLDSNAWLNDVRKGAAQNELNIQRRQAKVQEEIDKILMQYEFVQQAQKTFGDKLVKLGLITDGYEKVVQQLADGTEIVANTKNVQALANKVVKLDAKTLFGIDTGSANDLAKLIADIMTDDQGVREVFASMFPKLDEWMEQPEQYKEQMQAFYKALIDMDSDYYKALKQNYEQEKREFSERWQSMGWTAQEKRENTAFETKDNLRKISGQGETFGQTYGFADTIADDPEIARIKNRMEWRAKELEDLKARNASEELIIEKQNEMLKEAASLAEKVSQEVANRISKIQTLSEPLNSFGEEIGTMLGEQWQGISREGKLSFGEMAKNMGIEYAKLTLKMASENLMKQVQQGLFYKQMEMQEMEHQVQMTNIQNMGAQARIAGQITAGTTLQTIKAGQDAAEIGAEGSKATVMAMFGISEGAAKTIAKLGFWGIPLIGVITSILMGLLNSAKATAGQESSNSSTSNSTKTKLVSSMLTYDKGNIQRFIGQDGKVYTATEVPAPKDGLVMHPIATTVQGQPALVAEKGPEIVLGRQTTRAIMMNEPELINYLANYDKYGGRRMYDSGNARDITLSRNNDITTGTNDNAEMRKTINEMREVMAGVLYYLQNPVSPEISMYDTGGKKGLHTKIMEANRFMAQYKR